MTVALQTAQTNQAQIYVLSSGMPPHELLFFALVKAYSSTENNTAFILKTKAALKLPALS